MKTTRIYNPKHLRNLSIIALLFLCSEAHLQPSTSALFNPAIPAAPMIYPATTITTSSFTANWMPSREATSYRIDVSTSSTFSAFLPGYNNLSASGTSIKVAGLTGKNTYYYRVRAENVSGTSGNSMVASVTLELDQR